MNALIKKYVKSYRDGRMKLNVRKAFQSSDGKELLSKIKNHKQVIVQLHSDKK